MHATRAGAMQVRLVACASGVLLWTGLTAAQAVSDLMHRARDAAAAGQQATGIVFHDTNGNGVRDSAERGLPGVLVTNGLNVVQTDADGRYTLTQWDAAAAESGLPRCRSHRATAGVHRLRAHVCGRVGSVQGLDDRREHAVGSDEHRMAPHPASRQLAGPLRQQLKLAEPHPRN
jgi:hypothetical protein